MKKKIISLFALILCICIAFSGCSSVSTLLSGSDESIKFKIENGEFVLENFLEKLNELKKEN